MGHFLKFALERSDTPPAFVILPPKPAVVLPVLQQQQPAANIGRELVERI